MYEFGKYLVTSYIAYLQCDQILELKFAQKVAAPIFLKKSLNIWATLVRKLVTENFLKSPNPVTLPAYANDKFAIRFLFKSIPVTKGISNRYEVNSTSLFTCCRLRNMFKANHRWSIWSEFAWSDSWQETTFRAERM